ncbi:hypothetical protein GQ55_3G448900 [Panicum hallii var. hallii]|uniref:Uncharacterized protein n=1 Tax=Panicum hallii var. hallii TaxID=1504633 RepID=A0A2T7EIG2_9POAL|nr:hypothetical protein GQ55_3G448900 [Panicum hallii var. hallii]
MQVVARLDGASWSTAAAGCNAMVQTCGGQYPTGNMAMVQSQDGLCHPWLKERSSKDLVWRLLGRDVYLLMQ